MPWCSSTHLVWLCHLQNTARALCYVVGVILLDLHLLLAVITLMSHLWVMDTSLTTS